MFENHKEGTMLPFLKSSLVAALSSCLFIPMTYANTEINQKIDALYKEIDQLKAMVAQQNAQLQQTQNTTATLVANTEKADQMNAKARSKGGAEVTLYGFVRADAAYQLEGGNGIFNRINNVPLEGDANKKQTENRFDSTLTSSRIGMDLKTKLADKDINAKVEVDFRGGDKNDTIRIRHAYLAWDNWLVGQTTSSFLSTETLPELLDFNGVLGGGVYRTPMVRYSHALSPDTQFLVGIEKSSDTNEFPALTAKVSQKLANNKLLINGRVLAQEVRNRSQQKDLNEFGWGVAAGLQYQPANNVTVNANYSHVVGDDKYFLYNATNSYIQNNDLKLVEFDAVSAGLTYRINPKLRSSLGYGALFYDENATTGNESLQQAWLNLIYNPFKPVTFGMEYIYGERETMDNKKGKDSRLEFMAKYDF